MHACRQAGLVCDVCGVCPLCVGVPWPGEALADPLNQYKWFQYWCSRLWVVIDSPLMIDGPLDGKCNNRRETDDDDDDRGGREGWNQTYLSSKRMDV